MEYTLKQEFKTFNQPFVIEPDGFSSIIFLSDGDLFINSIDFSANGTAKFLLEPYVINATTYTITGHFTKVSVIKYYYIEISNE